MILIQILFAAVVGTTLMTLFSYLLSERQNKQFKEPVILNKLLKPLRFATIRNVSISGWGWLLHYSVGVVFALMFFWVWNVTEITPSVLSGALLGIPAGIIGITGWSVLFALHPDPPQIDFQNFYLQLMIAHMVYGVGAALGIRLAMWIL